MEVDGDLVLTDPNPNPDPDPDPDQVAELYRRTRLGPWSAADWQAGSDALSKG